MVASGFFASEPPHSGCFSPAPHPLPFSLISSSSSSFSPFRCPLQAPVYSPGLHFISFSKQPREARRHVALSSFLQPRRPRSREGKPLVQGHTAGERQSPESRCEASQTRTPDWTRAAPEGPLTPSRSVRPLPSPGIRMGSLAVWPPSSY